MRLEAMSLLLPLTWVGLAGRQHPPSSHHGALSSVTSRARNTARTTRGSLWCFYCGSSCLFSVTFQFLNTRGSAGDTASSPPPVRRAGGFGLGCGVIYFPAAF